MGWLLVFLLQETAVRTWSFWTCRSWRWQWEKAFQGVGLGVGDALSWGWTHWLRTERGMAEGASRGKLHLDHVQSSTRGPPRRREKAICRGICHGHRVQPRLLLSLPLSSPPSLAPSSQRGSHQQLRERKGKWGSLGERQDDHSWPPLVLTEKIKSTTWELRAKFYLGHIEDYSPGDNISDSFETALQRSRGKDRTCMILMKGSTWNQVHILAEAGC